MQQPTSSVFLFYIVVFAGSVLGALFISRAKSSWKRFRIARRLKRGVQAEKKVGRILKKYGYSIVEIQPSFSLKVTVDGKLLSYEVRPDAIAKKNNCFYFVEVKTGKVAINPLYRETRRQLLEYYHSASYKGILLVNADAEVVSLVQFPRIVAKASYSQMALFFLGGMAVSALLFSYFLF